MKKLLFLVFFLAGCATYHQTISSNKKIDVNAKTIAVETSNLSEINQDFRHILNDSDFQIYNKNSGAARYELSEDITLDENVRCGLFETGYSYDITLTDNRKKEEVFTMQGQGCREAILRDFTALINNQYGETKEAEPVDDETMKAPNLRSDGRTWWSN